MATRLPRNSGPLNRFGRTQPPLASLRMPVAPASGPNSLHLPRLASSPPRRRISPTRASYNPPLRRCSPPSRALLDEKRRLQGGRQELGKERLIGLRSTPSPDQTFGDAQSHGALSSLLTCRLPALTSPRRVPSIRLGAYTEIPHAVPLPFHRTLTCHPRGVAPIAPSHPKFIMRTWLTAEPHGSERQGAVTVSQHSDIEALSGQYSPTPHGGTSNQRTTTR